jgi:hypothetical protein
LRSVDVRPRQLESVLDQLEARLCIVGNDHFNDIETEKNVGVVEHAQPGEPAASDPFLFIGIDGGDGPAKFFAATRFYFDEYESVVVARDEVDLAAAPATKITIKNFVAFPAQEFSRQFLAERAAAQVWRFQ